MKRNLSAVALLLLLTTGARAQQEAMSNDKALTPAEDCSKQVWPNFSPSCLRNAGQATNIRLVSTQRR